MVLSHNVFKNYSVTICFLKKWSSTLKMHRRSKCIYILLPLPSHQAQTVKTQGFVVLLLPHLYQLNPSTRKSRCLKGKMLFSPLQLRVHWFNPHINT